MNNFLKNLSLASLVAITAALTLSAATAQTAPEFIITWKSDNYAPPSYQGKILPIPNSKIDMALELIDGGKLANLSGYEVRWLINDDELKSGFGLKNISFTADGLVGDQEIAITIKGYRGQDLTKNKTIPLARPEAVIVGSSGIFQILPYFFNVQNLSQLSLVWSVNNRAVGGLVDDPTTIELDTTNYPANSLINLGIEVRNTDNPKEVASQSINITK